MIQKRGLICEFLLFREEKMRSVKSVKNRKNLYKKITSLKKEHSADIFVLSVHCEEPEYVRIVTKKRKDFYHNLLDAGVDILWANHPHVSQEWEVVKSDKTPYKTKYIMYSVGNFVSGQRYRRNYPYD